MNGRRFSAFCTLFVCALLLPLGCGGDANDGTAPTSPGESVEREQGPPLGDFQDDYEQMAARLELSPEESTALEAAWQQHLTDLENWWARHGKTLVEHEAKLKQAARDRDLSALNAAKAQADPLRSEFRALGRAGEQRVLMALSPDKRRDWDAEQLLIKFEELTAGKMELTPEQQTAARTLARQHAAEADPDLSVQNRLAGPFLHFERDLENMVLTNEQKATYAEIKDRNKMRSLSW